MVQGILIAVASLVTEHGPKVYGLQQSWPTGLAASHPVESSQTKDQTHVFCIGRWVLNHWTTSEVPGYFLNFLSIDCL